MGAKYATNTASGYNSSAPADDGTQSSANLVTWAGIKSKLGDPVKTLAEDINSDLVTAFDYSVRSLDASGNTVAGDHMRCVEIASTVSSAVTVSLGDASTMTNVYRVYIKNSSNMAQTVGRVTGGDTIDGSASNLTLPAYSGVELQTNANANGYITLASTFGIPNTAAQTFLGADVDLNNTSNYFNVVNTGSIGAAGQIWRISAVANVLDTAGNAQILVRIWDGSSTVYVETALGYTLVTASAGNPVYVEAIVTLSAATTFYLSCKDLTSTSGKVKTTGSAGTANKATWITAVRLS